MNNLGSFGDNHSRYWYYPPHNHADFWNIVSNFCVRYVDSLTFSSLILYSEADSRACYSHACIDTIKTDPRCPFNRHRGSRRITAPHTSTSDTLLTMSYVAGYKVCFMIFSQLSYASIDKIHQVVYGKSQKERPPDAIKAIPGPKSNDVNEGFGGKCVHRIYSTRAIRFDVSTFC